MSGFLGQQILIVGGGIAGLASAVALAWRGAKPIVLERAPQLSEVGAGLQLSPNAIWAARRLGIYHHLKQTAVRPERLAVRSGKTNRLLTSMPLGTSIVQAHGAETLVTHRADLLASLLKTAAALDIDIRTDHVVVDLETHQKGVTVLCEHAHGVRNVSAALLVAADGVWSSIRTKRLKGPPAQRVSKTAWRTTLDVQTTDALGSMPNEVSLWLGARSHLVQYPIRSGLKLNLVAIADDTWTGEDWNEPGDVSALHAHFAGWASPIKDLLRTSSSWTKWPLAVVDPIYPWTLDNRILLIGDAAHAMLPFGAQGAAMALEDATELAVQLDAFAPNFDQALAQYVRIRRPRVSHVARAAEHNGWRFHLSGPAGMARDHVLRRMNGERLLKQQSEIYGWKPSQFAS